MQIIVPPKKYTEGDRAKALERELRSGAQFLRALENKREIVARAQAAPLKKHREVPGLGRCVAVIPELEFFDLNKKYGYKEVHSPDFLKYFQKRFPELAPHKL